MTSKIYSISDQDFVLEWGDHWFKFAHQIFSLLLDEESKFTPHTPSDIEEFEHYQLRAWFIENAERIIPLWGMFYEAKFAELEIDDDTPYLHWLNPFALFYEPEFLSQLAYTLHMQDTDYSWEPNERGAWDACMLLFTQGTIVRQFYDWVCSDGEGKADE